MSPEVNITDFRLRSTFDIKVKVIIMVTMNMHVAADDTRIVVLLVNFCCQGGIPTWTSGMMCFTLRDRAVIHINAIVDQHSHIIAVVWLLEAH